MDKGESLRLRFDAFELDEADARLKREGIAIALAPKAFAVLCALARTPGALVTKEALLDSVWGHQHVSESVLKTIVSELRAALGDDARQPRYIETASRRGYRFIGVPKVSVATRATDAAPSSKTDVPGAPPRQPDAGRPLIGREQALAQLRSAWQRTMNGERQLIWIAGEAGIGKSRLIQSFISELPPQTAAFGQCVELFGTGEPYLPILEAIKELCRREPHIVEVMRTVAPTWLVQMPWLISESERATLHREVAGAHQDRMVREMRELMDRYTAHRPLVFVLEDLHWSDHGTLRMMEHFARRPRDVKLMWIASFRLTQVIAEGHPLRELRQELRLHRLCDEIILEPFSESEVGRYMQSRMPDVPLPEHFIRRLHAHTEGLPLFVANVADTFLTQAANESDAMNRWINASASAPLPVPDNLAGVIDKQISRLPAEPLSVLEAASVCGVDFSAAMVAEMLDRDVFWVAAHCDELVRKMFWLRASEVIELSEDRFDSRYTFLHAVYRHVFYQRLSLAQRVQLHRRAATVLERWRADGQVVAPAELASHYERGHQIISALRAYVDAARHAVMHFAPMEAINVTTTACELLERCPQTEQRLSLELDLVHLRGVASAQLFGVGAPETCAAFERAQALGELLPQTPERVLLFNGLGLTRYIQGNYSQARKIAERILELGTRFQNPVAKLCGLLLTGMIEALQAHHALACRTLEEGIEVARQIDDAVPLTAFVIDPLVALRANLALPLMHLGLADQAAHQIELARQRAERVGQPTARMLVFWVSGLIAVRRDEPERVLSMAKCLHEVVDDGMLTQGYGPARWLRGWAEAQLGSPQRGYELIREGFDGHAKLGMFAGNTETLSFAAEALILAGDWVKADALLDEATKLVERIDEHVILTSLLLSRAKVAHARGDATSAKQFMREALSTARAQGSPFFELRALMALCELPEREQDDLDALRILHASMREGTDMPLAQRAAQLIA